MKLDCTCAPAAFDSWCLSSRRPAAAMIACSLREIKKTNEENQINVTVLQDYKPSLSQPCSSCAPPAPRTGRPRVRASSPSSSGGSFGSSCNKNVTQKRTQNETGLRSTLLPVLCCLIPRTYIEPFWIALTLKEKRHYEVCLERLGEEARHRRLVIVFPTHNT